VKGMCKGNVGARSAQAVCIASSSRAATPRARGVPKLVAYMWMDARGLRVLLAAYSRARSVPADGCQGPGQDETRRRLGFLKVRKSEIPR
jgi:hypothetical protein